MLLLLLLPISWSSSTPTLSPWTSNACASEPTALRVGSQTMPPSPWEMCFTRPAYLMDTCDIYYDAYDDVLEYDVVWLYVYTVVDCMYVRYVLCLMCVRTWGMNCSDWRDKNRFGLTQKNTHTYISMELSNRQSNIYPPPGRRRIHPSSWCVHSPTISTIYCTYQLAYFHTIEESAPTDRLEYGELGSRILLSSLPGGGTYLVLHHCRFVSL